MEKNTSIPDMETREAIRGHVDSEFWGDLAKETLQGAAGGAAGAGLVSGGTAALPGAAGGALYGAGYKLLSDIWYKTRRNEDKIAWQAGDLQEVVEQLANMAQKNIPEEYLPEDVLLTLRKYTTDFKNLIDYYVRDAKTGQLENNDLMSKWTGDQQSSVPSPQPTNPTTPIAPVLPTSPTPVLASKKFTRVAGSKFKRVAQYDPNPQQIRPQDQNAAAWGQGIAGGAGLAGGYFANRALLNRGLNKLDFSDPAIDATIESILKRTRGKVNIQDVVGVVAKQHNISFDAARGKVLDSMIKHPEYTSYLDTMPFANSGIKMAPQDMIDMVQTRAYREMNSIIHDPGIPDQLKLKQLKKMGYNNIVQQDIDDVLANRKTLNQLLPKFDAEDIKNSLIPLGKGELSNQMKNLGKGLKGLGVGMVADWGAGKLYDSIGHWAQGGDIPAIQKYSQQGKDILEEMGELSQSLPNDAKAKIYGAGNYIWNLIDYIQKALVKMQQQPQGVQQPQEIR